MKEGSCWLWYACGPAATGMLARQTSGRGRVLKRERMVMRPGCAVLGGEAGALGGKANVDGMKQGVLRV